MKYLLAISILCATLGVNAASVAGKLTNPNGQQIILERLTTTGITPLDTATLDASGTFSFKTTAKERSFYRLRVTQNNWINIILDPKDKLTLSAKADSLRSTAVVKGSRESIRLQQLNLELTKRFLVRQQLSMASQQARKAGKLNEVNAIAQKEQAIIKEVRTYVRQFIDEDPGSLASLAAIEQLQADQDMAYYKKVLAAMQQKLPDSEYTKSFATRIKDLSYLAIGTEAPDLKLKTTEGADLALSDLRGQVVLLDFWASWCGPCRRENPHVVKAYNKYKDKGFTVYSVSLDNSADRWKGAITKDGLIWPNHVSDLKGWKSAACPVYKVSGIPQTFLIDKEGNILAKNLRGQALDNKLEEIFGVN